jgi:hypothetical protein
MFGGKSGIIVLFGGIEGIFSKVSVRHWDGAFHEKRHCNAYHQKSVITKQPTGTQG